MLGGQSTIMIHAFPPSAPHVIANLIRCVATNVMNIIIYLRVIYVNLTVLLLLSSLDKSNYSTVHYCYIGLTRPSPNHEILPEIYVCQTSRRRI